MAQRTKRNQKTTKLRKGQGSLDHMAIVSDYTEGTLSVGEIAKAHATSEENVGLIVTRHWKALCNMRESRLLLGNVESPKQVVEAKNALDSLRNTKLINEDFLKLLSDPKTALLSDSEAIYCWHLVHSGDLREALKLSGLDTGLHRDKGPTGSGSDRDTRYSYDRALTLRSQYLNAKPNVMSYITQLREERLINADVGRSKIQSELIEQLEQMKCANDPARYRTQILRTIELLGKTVGAFVDRVEVTEASPSDALDRLIELAQEAEVKEISESTEVTQ